MEYKNAVSGLLIALFSSSVFSAECYIRSATVSQSAKAIERIADKDRQIVPHAKNQNKCIVTFRAYISGKWYLAQGESIADSWGSIDQACAKAEQSGRMNILERVSGNKLSVDQEMMCTDKPLPKDNKTAVNVGDMLWESEVQPHPVYKDNFSFRGSLCRWFVETAPTKGSVEMSQGIICRRPDQTAWKVVDKW